MNQTFLVYHPKGYTNEYKGFLNTLQYFQELADEIVPHVKDNAGFQIVVERFVEEDRLTIPIYEVTELLETDYIYIYPSRIEIHNANQSICLYRHILQYKRRHSQKYVFKFLYNYPNIYYKLLKRIYKLIKYSDSCYRKMYFLSQQKAACELIFEHLPGLAESYKEKYNVEFKFSRSEWDISVTGKSFRMIAYPSILFTAKIQLWADAKSLRFSDIQLNLVPVKLRGLKDFGNFLAALPTELKEIENIFSAFIDDCNVLLKNI